MFRQRLTQRLLGESHSTRAIRRLIPFAQVVGLVLLAAGTSQGQWLEKTIYLPDEFGGLIWPHCVAFDTLRNKAYFGGGYSSLRDDSSFTSEGSWVVVVDAATLKRTGHIRVPGKVARMGLNPVTEKLYCALYDSNAVCVIDCKTDSVVATINLPHWPDSLCVNPDENKVYCALNLDAAIIDGATDTVLTIVPVPDGVASMYYASVNSTVYCYSSDWDGRVTLIDGHGDSVRAVVELGSPPDGAYGACWNSIENAYYCIGFFANAYWLFVIDGFGDSLKARVPLGDLTEGICWNPADNRVYCVSYRDSIFVVDCSADTIETVFPLPRGSGCFRIACSPKSGRLYCTNKAESWWRNVYVADCIGDSFLGVFPTGQDPLDVQYDPKYNRLFTVNHESDDVTVIDCASDSVVATIGLGFRARSLVYASEEDKVYCGGRSYERILAIDAATNRVVAEIPIGTLVTSMCYNPVLSKLYSVCGDHDTVIAIDCRRDSVVARIGVGDMPMYLAFSPVGGSKIYCANAEDSFVSVIDCVRDSVIAEIDVGSDAWDLLANTREDKVYCHARNDRTVVIDCLGDTILRRSDVVGTGLVYSPEENKAYIGYGDLHVIDGHTDSSIATVDTVFSQSWGTGCYNYRNRKTYVRAGYVLLVLDGVADSLLALYTEPGGGYGMTQPFYNSMSNEIYIAFRADDFVGVFDGATDSVLARIPVGSYPETMAWSPVSNRTYVACYLGSCVSVIRDSLVPGVEEGYKRQAASRKQEPTVVRGVLRLVDSKQQTGHWAELLDAVGCVVMELVPGENDVRQLSPGVYFVREARSQAIRKVMVAR